MAKINPHTRCLTGREEPVDVSAHMAFARRDGQVRAFGLRDKVNAPRGSGCEQVHITRREREFFLPVGFGTVCGADDLR